MLWQALGRATIAVGGQRPCWGVQRPVFGDGRAVSDGVRRPAFGDGRASADGGRAAAPGGRRLMACSGVLGKDVLQFFFSYRRCWLVVPWLSVRAVLAIIMVIVWIIRS
jgi:hypothetical protein